MFLGSKSCAYGVVSVTGFGNSSFWFRAARFGRVGIRALAGYGISGSDSWRHVILGRRQPREPPHNRKQ